MADLESFLQDLERRAMLAEHRIAETQKSAKDKEELEKLLEALQAEKKRVEIAFRYIQKVGKTLANHTAKKKKMALNGIEAAIMAANTVVPDAGKVQFYNDGKEAFFLDEKGELINMVEGSAYRSSLSIFARSVFLECSSYMPFVLLDEALTTLSADSSVNVSRCIRDLAENMQIILVEQKDEVFADSPRVDYIFKKTEGVTQVRREVCD